MPKRKLSSDDEVPVAPTVVKGPVKNSLDSDEEDNEDEGDGRYRLKDEDIPGQEEGVVGLEDGVQITPFNMKEELEEGHFDNDGMYHWKKEKLARDNWLENIDWIKVKQIEGIKNKQDASEDDLPEALDVNAVYKEILKFLQPKETVAKALKRLGGSKSLSASERLKLKKAGLSYNTNKGTNEEVIKLTELANKILTHLGNMDVYQETYEMISDKIAASSSTAPAEDDDLDMYADDFEEKEKAKLQNRSSATEPQFGNDENVTEGSKGGEIMWEFKKKEDSGEIEGPYSSSQMNKFSMSGKFGSSGVLVRKCGTERFYTSTRIDFDLYI